MFANLLKKIFLLLFFFNFSIGMMTAQNLSKHQWKNRVLIVSFEDPNQPEYLAQMQELKINQKGLEERKLIVYQVCKDQYKKGLDEKSEWQKITPGDLHKIIKEVQTDFSVILIGLDGGSKEQRSSLFNINELFRIIDSMPMRAQEMKRLKKRN